jgi:YaiO family outer membrane protein
MNIKPALMAVAVAAMIMVASSMSAPAQTVEVETGSEYQDLTRNLSPWWRTYITFLDRIGAGKGIYAELQRTSRYSQTDASIMAGGYFPLSRRWTGAAELSVSPSHRILPKWAAAGQVQRELGHGWSSEAGIRRREYREGGVTIGSAGVSKGVKTLRTGYTLYTSHLSNAGVAFTNRVDVTHHYASSAITLTLASGDELEKIAPASILRTSVALINVHGTHWLDRSWGISYGAEWHRQGTLHTRRGLTIGVRYRSDRQ